MQSGSKQSDSRIKTLIFRRTCPNQIKLYISEDIELRLRSPKRPYSESNGDVPKDAGFEPAAIPLRDMGFSTLLRRKPLSFCVRAPLKRRYAIWAIIDLEEFSF